MSILDRLRHGAGHETPSAAQDVSTAQDPETQATAGAVLGDEKVDINEIIDRRMPSQDAQLGFQKIEAVTQAWTKKSLAAALFLIWLIFLTNGFRMAILASLTPYVTSDFQSHSLLTVIGIVADTMTAAVYIPMAKMLDVWGRAEGFLVMVSCSTLGVILMAISHNLATFCAAQVFCSIGFAGIIYTVAVLAADATNLRNRGIAIIVPGVTIPLFVVLKLNLRKATKQGILVKESSGRTLFQSIKHGIIEFDAVGVVLFAAGLTLFLLPFTLATSAPNGWKTGYVIGMVVAGLVTLVLFALYQMYLAPTPFLKNQFITDRTVLGTCLIDMTYQISYYCWNSYFTSFLRVVNNLSVAVAGYVNSTFQVVSGVLLFIVGYLIRRTGRFKWLFYVTIPIYIFGLGLMIHFRRPNIHIGFIVMCEIFISIGGTVFILLVQLAVLAAVDHQHVAAALALLYVSGTMDGAIWTNTFPKALGHYLPGSALPDLVLIYSDITKQLSYPVGSDERVVIQKAYGYAQTRMLALGTGIMALCFVWMLLLKNYNVAKMTQTKGIVL